MDSTTPFKRHETNDISSEVDPDQIQVILLPHEFSMKNDRITSIGFKYEFTFAVK